MPRSVQQLALVCSMLSLVFAVSVNSAIAAAAGAAASAATAATDSNADLVDVAMVSTSNSFLALEEDQELANAQENSAKDPNWGLFGAFGCPQPPVQQPCPDGKYFVKGVPGGQAQLCDQCMPCDSSCATCNAPPPGANTDNVWAGNLVKLDTLCTSCRPNSKVDGPDVPWYMQKVGRCVLVPTTPPAPTTTPPPIKCDPSCATCFGTTWMQCITCPVGKMLLFGFCL